MILTDPFVAFELDSLDYHFPVYNNLYITMQNIFILE